MCSVTHFTQTTAREKRNVGTKKGSKEASFISGDYAFIFLWLLSSEGKLGQRYSPNIAVCTPENPPIPNVTDLINSVAK